MESSLARFHERRELSNTSTTRYDFNKLDLILIFRLKFLCCVRMNLTWPRTWQNETLCKLRKCFVGHVRKIERTILQRYGI